MNTLQLEQLKKQYRMIKILGSYTIKDRTISELDELYYDQYYKIFCYKYFIIQTYGPGVWYDLLDHEKFSRLFYYSIKVYGDGIIECLVDISVEYLNIPTSYILTDFSKYVKAIENPEILKFVQLT